MSSVGSCLSEMRLKHGFSLAEMARATRVTSRYLEALESDKFSELPPPVFTRGFIRAFCSTLGESPDTALALYERHLEATAGPRQPVPRLDRRPAPVAGRATRGADAARGRSAVFVSFVLLIALGAALLAVVMTLQGRRESAERRDVAMARSEAQAVPTSTPSPPPEPSKTPPASSSAASPSATAALPAPAGGTAMARPEASSVAPPSSARTPAVPPPTAATSDAASAAAGTVIADAVSVPYRLVAKTRALTWVRVRTEGGKGTEENVPAGEVREWVSNRPFLITVGNAGGVSFELNGRPLPPLGAEGAVVREVIVPGPR
jgi:cytoskeleton protein RodZ